MTDLAPRGSELPTAYLRPGEARGAADRMSELTTDDVARLFAVPERTAQRWVRAWATAQHDPRTPRVRRAAVDSRKWRYLVDASTLRARFPALRIAA